MDDPLVALVADAARLLEEGHTPTVRLLAGLSDRSFGTVQRLHVEARRRGWLDAGGYPTAEGLVACGRV